MTETFRTEIASDPAPFTGERLTSARGGQVRIEHYHRYLFARAFCQGRDVLDVASGEGYGAAQLAQTARDVIGLEFASDAVRGAAANFPRPNLRFAQGDARRMPLRDASVDVVVSFETIEHFDGQDAFLAEIRRVMRPDGVCIISTPDRAVYPPGNPFHTREFNRDEYLELLHRYFPHVQLSRQRPMIGSAIVPDNVPAAVPLLFDHPDAASFTTSAILPRAPYLIAVAGGTPIPPPPFSLMIERDDLDSDGMALAEALAAVRCGEDALARAEEALLRAEEALLRAEEDGAAALRLAREGWWPRLRRRLAV